MAIDKENQLQRKRRKQLYKTLSEIGVLYWFASALRLLPHPNSTICELPAANSLALVVIIQELWNWVCTTNLAEIHHDPAGNFSATLPMVFPLFILLLFCVN